MQLLGYVHRKGAQRAANDLVVAATAVGTRRMLVTSGRRARFQDLPGVEYLELP